MSHCAINVVTRQSLLEKIHISVWREWFIILDGQISWSSQLEWLCQAGVFFSFSSVLSSSGLFQCFPNDGVFQCMVRLGWLGIFSCCQSTVMLLLGKVNWVIHKIVYKYFI